MAIEKTQASSHRLSFDKSEIVVEKCPGEAHHNHFIDHCLTCMGSGWGIIAYDKKDSSRRPVKASLGAYVKTFDYGDAEVSRLVAPVIAEQRLGTGLRASAEVIAKERYETSVSPPAVVAMVQAVLVVIVKGPDLYENEGLSNKCERAVRAALVSLYQSVGLQAGLKNLKSSAV